MQSGLQMKIKCGLFVTGLFLLSGHLFGELNVQIGDSYDTVIKNTGSPKGVLKMGDSTALLYEEGTIHLTSNLVSKIQQKSPQEIEDARLLQKKRQNAPKEEFLSEKQIAIFKDSIKKNQAEYQSLQRKRSAAQNNRNSLKCRSDSDYNTMMSRRRSCRLSSNGNPRRGNTSCDEYRYNLYITSKGTASKSYRKLQEAEKTLKQIDKRLRELKGNIASNKAFLKRNELKLKQSDRTKADDS